MITCIVCTSEVYRIGIYYYCSLCLSIAQTIEILEEEEEYDLAN
jgi:hypothetical protein